MAEFVPLDIEPLEFAVRFSTLNLGRAVASFGYKAIVTCIPADLSRVSTPIYDQLLDEMWPPIIVSF
jgi:hypothetical protein